MKLKVIGLLATVSISLCLGACSNNLSTQKNHEDNTDALTTHITSEFTTYFNKNKEEKKSIKYTALKVLQDSGNILTLEEYKNGFLDTREKTPVEYADYMNKESKGINKEVKVYVFQHKEKENVYTLYEVYFTLDNEYLGYTIYN